MTAAQRDWMDEHPAFERWKPQSIFSVYGWTEIGWLYPSGRFVPDGTTFGWAWPMHLMSSGDTLYLIPSEAMKIGRRYMIV